MHLEFVRIIQILIIMYVNSYTGNYITFKFFFILQFIYFLFLSFNYQQSKLMQLHFVNRFYLLYI